jgi:uridylate kinase
MRIVFRIGGSVVASPVNTDLIKQYIELLKTVKTKGHEVAVVVGGGSLAREFINIARSLGLEMQAQDEIAISVSRLFAQLFIKKFGTDSCGKVATTLDEAAECISQGKILVMGGLKPGITTDTVGALVAERISADLLVKGSDQDGVFTKDPRKHFDATKLDQLSYDDLQAVFSETEHKAGIHQIIDPEAIKVLKRKRVKLIVVNGYKPQNVLAAVNGEKIGTVIQ